MEPNPALRFPEGRESLLEVLSSPFAHRQMLQFDTHRASCFREVHFGICALTFTDALFFDWSLPDHQKSTIRFLRLR